MLKIEGIQKIRNDPKIVQSLHSNTAPAELKHRPSNGELGKSQKRVQQILQGERGLEMQITEYEF